ncbi:MAG: pyridoxal-phosphate dependent enzyme, partial [Gloeomargarita sp. DG_1_4_bins_134]
PHPETVATAIRIGNPVNWQSAIAVQEASQGAFYAVSDSEILSAYQLLAREEGIFCEPASAAAVAGLFHIQDQIPEGARIVCVLTGNGLKDPDNAIAVGQQQLAQGIAPERDVLARAMGLLG